MSLRKQTRNLLQLARKDRRAAEKTPKAWLLSIGVEYPRTHDLSSLLSELQDRNQPVDGYWDLVELNPLAVQFRYELLEEEHFD